MTVNSDSTHEGRQLGGGSSQPRNELPPIVQNTYNYPFHQGLSLPGMYQNVPEIGYFMISTPHPGQFPSNVGGSAIGEQFKRVLRDAANKGVVEVPCPAPFEEVSCTLASKLRSTLPPSSHVSAPEAVPGLVILPHCELPRPPLVITENGVDKKSTNLFVSAIHFAKAGSSKSKASTPPMNIEVVVNTASASVSEASVSVPVIPTQVVEDYGVPSLSAPKKVTISGFASRLAEAKQSHYESFKEALKKEDRKVTRIGRIMESRINYTIDELLEAKSYALSVLVPLTFITGDSKVLPFMMINASKKKPDRVPYNRSNTAWVSHMSRLSKLSGEEGRFEKFKLDIQSAFNKLAQDNYRIVVTELKSFMVYDEKSFVFFTKCVAKCISKNASFVNLYSRVCVDLYEQIKKTQLDLAATFKKILVSEIMELTKVDEEWQENHQKLLKRVCKSADDFDLLNEEIMVFEDKQRRVNLGAVEFLACLDILRFVDRTDSLQFALSLIGKTHTLELEMLCKFTGMVGSDIDYYLPNKLDPVFDFLHQSIINSSCRLQFMVEDLTRRREEKWPTKYNEHALAGLVLTRQAQKGGDTSVPDQNVQFAPQRPKPSEVKDRNTSTDGSRRLQFFGSNKTYVDQPSRGYRGDRHQRGSGYDHVSNTRYGGIPSNRYGGLSSLLNADASSGHHTHKDISKNKKPDFGFTRRTGNTRITGSTRSTKPTELSTPQSVVSHEPQPEIAPVEDFVDPTQMVSSEEAMVVHFKSLVCSFMSGYDVDSFISEFMLTKLSHNMSMFVKMAFSYVVELEAFIFKHLGDLLVILMQEDRLTVAEFLNGFADFLLQVPDLIYDVPGIWKSISHSIVPLLLSSRISLSDCFRLLVKAGIENPETVLFNILVEVLNYTSKLTVRGMWARSGLNLTDFLPKVSETLLSSSGLEPVLNDKGDLAGLVFSHDALTCDDKALAVEIVEKLQEMEEADFRANTRDFCNLIHVGCPPGSVPRVEQYFSKCFDVMAPVFECLLRTGNKEKFLCCVDEALHRSSHKPFGFSKFLMKGLISSNFTTFEEIKMVSQNIHCSTFKCEVSLLSA